MTGIVPDSIVRILKGINIDKGYNDTLKFDDVEEQATFFQSKAVLTFGKDSYLREGVGRIKVEATVGTLLNCNYLMFKNSSYEDKWFYAFITSVDYVNDEVTAINYEIDTLQTWLFDFEFGDCFIEREHVLNDSIGKNIIQEDLELGEYVGELDMKVDLSEMSVGVIATKDIEDVKEGVMQNSKGDVYNGVFSGLVVRDGYRFSKMISTALRIDTGIGIKAQFLYSNDWTQVVSSDTHVKLTKNVSGHNILFDFDSPYLYCEIDDIKYKIDINSNNSGFSMTETPDGKYIFTYRTTRVFNTVIFTLNIPDTPDWYPTGADEIVSKLSQLPQDDILVNIYQYPSILDEGDKVNLAKRSYELDIGKEIGYYKPRNKKLFTYPYNYLAVSNNEGQMSELHWENFLYAVDEGFDDFVKLTLTGTKYGVPTTILYPNDYRGIKNDYESGNVLNSFPNCAWNNDVYKNWWYENRNSVITGTVTSAISAMVGVSGGIRTKNPIRMASNTWHMFEGVASTMAQISDKQKMPPQAKGQIQVDALNIGVGRCGYYIYKMHIKEEYLKRIDQFFDMYGYQVNEVKKPNVIYSKRFLRKQWNFVKMQKCVIHHKQGAGIPAGVEDELERIFINGITFWNNNEYVGEYSMDNSIPE